MFWQIFRSHQVNGVNLLACKQSFSRDIYITVIKQSLELFEGVSLSAFVICSSLSLLFIFQELLGMGFHSCIQFILDETKHTSHAGTVERDTCKGHSLQNFIVQTWQTFKKTLNQILKNTLFFLFTYFRHFFPACSLQNVQGEGENCTWVHSHQQRVGLHQQISKQEVAICFKH